VTEFLSGALLDNPHGSASPSPAS